MTTRRIPRPVKVDPPGARIPFVDPKTGILTPHGLKAVAFLRDRTGGDDDDIWSALGLGFQAIASQGRTDQRLQGLEGAVAGLASDVGGLRGDPRLQTADRAEAQSKDALAIALSRASPDVLRRVEELERAVAIVGAAVGEIRAQTRMAQRQQADEIRQIAVTSAFESSLQSYQSLQDRNRAQEVEDQVEAIESEFATRARDALSATAPIIYTEASGDFSLNASLTSLGGVTTAADKGYYTTGADTWASADLTAFGRSVWALADASVGRTLFGLVIGTDVQAYNANLAAFAGLSLVADRLPYANGAGTLALATFTAAGRAIVGAADAAAQRAALSLGTAATVNTGTSGATIPLLNATNTWAQQIIDVADGAYSLANNAPNGNLRFYPRHGTFAGSLIYAFSAGYAGEGPLGFAGSNFSWLVGLSEVASLSSGGVFHCASLSTGQTPTAAVVAQSHWAPVTLNGVTYKLLLAS